jgi:maleylpyruvate isomerase
MTTGYRLYGYWRSSSSWRVRIGLALKGLTYEYVAVDLLGGEQDGAEHVRRSPLHHVPVLELWEGARPTHRLLQSVAILEWLEEVHPAPPLLPRDPAGRSRVRSLVEHVNSSIQPYQNTVVLKWLREREAGSDRLFVRHFVERGLSGLEAAVRDGAGRFCHGDAPTLADCFLVPQLYAARRFEIPLAAYPTLLSVEAACAELPAFAAAHADRQPDAPKKDGRSA